MYNLAVIGAGQIGSRHLQALAKLDLPLELYVIDPSVDSLEVARQRYSELEINPMIKAVRFNTTLEGLPSRLDYVIISTSSKIRLSVLRSLLESHEINALLLEKILYTRLQDYLEAEALLNKNCVKTWVNCTRRAFPSYRALKQMLRGQLIVDFQVHGGEWGIGCNAIHYIDLLAYISPGATLVELNTDTLDAGCIPSKRNSFVEFTGTCNGRMSNGAFFTLTAVRGSTLRSLIRIRTEKCTMIVDEAAKTLLSFNDEEKRWHQQYFDVPLTSESMTLVATEILLHGTSHLATHTESVALHTPFLKGLLRHIGEDDKNLLAECLIT